MEFVMSVGTSSFQDGDLLESHQIYDCHSFRDLIPYVATETVEFSQIKEDSCAGSQCRSETDIGNEDCILEQPSTPGGRRMLMREWLLCNANNGSIPGLKWLDKKNGLISIAWKHGSKSSWSPHDGKVFEGWAKYTGKFNSTRNDHPRKWKANFRCAINSLPNVVLVPEKSTKTGSNPCQVYRILDEKPRRKGQQRSRSSSMSQVDRVRSNHRECQPDTTTTTAATTTEDDDDVTMASSMSEQKRNHWRMKQKSGTKGHLTSEPDSDQSLGNSNRKKVLIPTTVLELCSEDETMYDVSSDQLNELVLETQLTQTQTITDDQIPLFVFEHSSSIDLCFEDFDLYESGWPTKLEDITCKL